MTSSQSREQALKIVFQQFFNPELTAREIADLNLEADDVKTADFSLTLADLAIEKADELDDIIAAKLVRWTIDRLPIMSVCLLRLAISEILYVEKTADAIVANEAVELAKRYIGDKEAKFVNGVLGSVIADKNGTNQPGTASAEEPATTEDGE